MSSSSRSLVEAMQQDELSFPSWMKSDKTTATNLSEEDKIERHIQHVNRITPSVYGASLESGSGSIDFSPKQEEGQQDARQWMEERRVLGKKDYLDQITSAEHLRRVHSLTEATKNSKDLRRIQQIGSVTGSSFMPHRQVMNNVAHWRKEYSNSSDTEKLDEEAISGLLELGVDGEDIRFCSPPYPERLIQIIEDYDKEDLISHVQNSEYSIASHRFDNTSPLGIGGQTMTADPLEERATKLKEHDLYVKPDSGAGASLVMRLSYQDNQLRIDAGDPAITNVIEAYADPETHRRAQNAGAIEQITTTDGRKHSLVDPRREDAPKVNIHQRDIIAKEDNSIMLATSEEDLAQTLLELEQIYDQRGKQSYAEQAIDIPKIDGNTWEIRTINQYGVNGHNVTASYAKVGNSGLVANISKGGKGLQPQEAATQAFQNIDGVDEQAQAKSFVQQTERASNHVAQQLDNYLEGIVEDTFYLEPHFADVAIDFVADYTDNDVKPKVLDINPGYAMTALNDEATMNVKWQKELMRDRYTTNIRNHGAQALQNK